MIKFHLSPWEKHYWTRVVSQEYVQNKRIRNLEEIFSQVGLELKQESVKCRVCSTEKVKKKWSLDGFFHGTNVLVP